MVIFIFTTNQNIYLHSLVSYILLYFSLVVGISMSIFIGGLDI